jgi:hypothetical protein
MIERVKCTECDNMILPQTAEDNDGLCAPCVSVQRPSRFFGAVGLANWANEGSPAMAVRGT